MPQTPFEDGGDSDPDEEAVEGELVADSDAEAEVAEELLEVDIEKLLSEREEYLDSLRRVQADFENYKKRMLKQQTEHLERAAALLVEKLLPVLDNFDLALAHGSIDIEPIYRSLVSVLESEGLERLNPVGKPFDPNEHEAVAHDPADDEGSEDNPGPMVTGVLRAGYRWKGRVLRPAMVQVRG